MPALTWSTAHSATLWVYVLCARLLCVCRRSPWVCQQLYPISQLQYPEWSVVGFITSCYEVMVLLGRFSLSGPSRCSTSFPDEQRCSQFGFRVH